MTPDELIAQRTAAWERLADLRIKAQHGQLGRLSEAELVELGGLYRAVTSDLALAQRDFPRHALTRYLNQLVGQTHPLIYRGEPLILRRIKSFYGHDLPQLYRELAPFLLASALLFFGPAILMYIATQLNPDVANYVLPFSTRDMIESGKQWWKDLNGENEVGAALIMTNNLRVSFMAFAGGMLAGLFSLYVLVMNGLNLGAVLGLAQHYEHAGPLWEFVIGHGVLELSEITMAGGSGLMLGYAMLHPGLLSRRDALTLAAQKSVRLLLGSSPLLVFAGLIEGLISPTDAPAGLKYAIGITSGILLYGYMLLAGRSYTRVTRALRLRVRRLLSAGLVNS